MNNNDALSADELRRALMESDKTIIELQAKLLEDRHQRQAAGRSSEIALSASEDRYQRMIEEVEDYAILRLSKEGIIQNWNKGAERIKGYQEEEVVGKHFRLFYPNSDQETGLPEKLMVMAITEGKAVHEGWRVRKDGTQFWGSIVITALHDDNEDVIGFSKVTRDLTERKVAEDKLQSYNEQLEAQNRQLQHFAYAAAHDMKEPLRKIQLYISAILTGAESLSPDKRLNYLKSSQDAAGRMQGLIDDLLAFAKLSEPSQLFEPVDLNQIWQETLQFYEEPSTTFTASMVSGPLPVVQGIPFQLRQLFFNLVGNSLKYRHAGRELMINISAARTSLPAPHRAQPGEVRYHKISLEDNGIGFDPVFADKIFEMFERLHSREHYAGTGIGLAMCQKIVENHAGKIVAGGSEGEGARFDIYLPVERERSRL